jgi:uncharacterized membrane protein YdbT with pleckstrin-like domain
MENGHTLSHAQALVPERERERWQVVQFQIPEAFLSSSYLAAFSTPLVCEVVVVVVVPVVIVVRVVVVVDVVGVVIVNVVGVVVVVVIGVVVVVVVDDVDEVVVGVGR